MQPKAVKQLKNKPLNSSPQSPKIGYTWWEKVLPPAVLAIITTIFYLPSLSYPFQFDDLANITKKYHIRFFGSFSWRIIFTPRWMSEWLNKVNYYIGRFDPFYYRTFNVLMHIITGVLIFFVVLELCSRLKKQEFLQKNALLIAYVTSALFLLHPAQTQAVSYVIQARLEGMATMFVMLTCLLFLKAMSAPTRAWRIGYIISFLTAGVLLCGTKEIVIISPFLIAILDWFFVAESDWNDFSSRLWLHGLFFAVVFGSFLIHQKIHWFKDILTLKHEMTNNRGNILTDTPNEIITPLHYLISEFKVILHYLLIFLWPFDISVEYDWKLSRGFFAPDSFFPFIALALVASYCLYLAYKKRSSYLAFGLLWFFIAVAPRSSIIPSSELICDYKTYLPSVGWLFAIAVWLVYALCFIAEQFQLHEKGSFFYTLVLGGIGAVAGGYGYIVWTIMQQLAPGSKPFGVVLFAIPASLIYMIWHLHTNHRHQTLFSSRNLILGALALLLGLGWSTTERNTVWSNPVAFWSDIVVKAPYKARGHNNLGVALSESGRFEESIDHYKRAIHLDDHYADPWSNIAVAYSMKGDNDAAINALQNAVRIFPHYPEAYNNLGTLLLQKKDYERAEQALSLAIQLRPWYGKAHFNMARLHLEKERPELALESMKRATKGDLDDVMGFQTLGQLSMRFNKHHDAIEAFKKAVSLGATNPEIYFNLANAYFMTDQYDTAEQIYRHIVQISPDNPGYLYNFGETLFKKEKYAEALDIFDRAKGCADAIPQSHFRYASCLEKLNRVSDLHNYLQLMANAQAPDWFKESAKQEYARLFGTPQDQSSVIMAQGTAGNKQT